MKWFLRIIGLWTIADALFVMFAPKQWARWWTRWIVAIGEGGWGSRLFGLLELASAAYILQIAPAASELTATRSRRGNRHRPQ